MIFYVEKKKQSASETNRVYKSARHKINIQKSTIFVYTSCEQLSIKIKNKNTINYSIKCEMPRDKYDEDVNGMYDKSYKHCCEKLKF